MKPSPLVTFIEQTLTQALAPTFLEVINESEQHQGHAGYSDDGSHFAVTIAASAFANKTLVECHRLIYQALGEKVGNQIHALRINIQR